MIARVMRAHRRYASANGDALSAALTYSLLVSAAPFVALAVLVLDGLGVSSERVAAAVHRSAGTVLPAHVAAAVDRVQPGPVALRVALVAALVWGSLRLISVLRTGVRAMCGQPAGSGNPVRDTARDAVLGVGLLAAVAAATAVTAFVAAGRWWGGALSIPVIGLLLAAAMVRCARRGEGRPAWPAALRAGLAAAVALHLLTVAAGPYFAATAALHTTLYRSAGAVVGVLVWCNVACGTVLRATAWAATARREESTVDGPLWVVVPAYNEATSVGATLAALAAQSDVDFSLVVVDNGSTDDTAGVVRAFAEGAPFPVTVLHEPERGPGAAVDTGARYAIGRGATVLMRTDADCVPATDWVVTARSVLGSGAEMVCGRSVPRRDEAPSLAERHLFPAAVRLAAVYGRYRPAHRRPQFRTPYVLCHGHNLAITAELYQRCGGASRMPLDHGSEDLELLNRARMHSDRIVRAEHLVVYNSLRRLRAWGARRTLLWYWDRRYRPTDEAAVHVRTVR